MPAEPHPDLKSNVEALGILGGGGSREDLPCWARFLIEVGLVAGRTPVDGRRCTIALLLPTRAYAAALCATGAALASHEAEASVSAAAHFRALGGLDPGAPVRLQIKRRGKWRVVPGSFRGVTGDGQRIRIGHGDGEMTQLPAALSWRVNPAASPSATASPKRGKARILAVSPFTEAILSQSGALQFAAGGNAASLIIGSRKHIEMEMQHRAFAARGAAGSSTAAGMLDDIARLQNRAGAGAAYRTAIHPPYGTSGKVPADVPPVVIFDGANGYLNFRDRFRSSHAIVLLDRTEPQIGNAAYQIQGDYDQRRLDGGAPLLLPPVPLPIEAHWFWLASS